MRFSTRPLHCYKSEEIRKTLSRLKPSATPEGYYNKYIYIYIVEFKVIPTFSFLFAQNLFSCFLFSPASSATRPFVGTRAPPSLPFVYKRPLIMRTLPATATTTASSLSIDCSISIRNPLFNERASERVRPDIEILSRVVYNFRSTVRGRGFYFFYLLPVCFFLSTRTGVQVRHSYFSSSSS